LEIGPGAGGGHLQELRRLGGQVVALEIDELASGALQQSNINVCKSIHDLRGPFDVVIASMVLEHLIDPAEYMAHIAKLSSTAGRLLITVPNADEVRNAGPYWVGFRVDLEHLNYFGMRSLGRILHRENFAIECQWCEVQPMLPAYLPMADRRRFVDSIRSVVGTSRIRMAADPFLETGTYSLILLARRHVESIVSDH
jgi:hypothetical protein